MEELSELIIELLKTHSRVSLPGLGAFIATSQAAVINKSNNSITPPSKKITFSKSETWNDGLLENLYAERRGMNLEEARDRLRHIIIDIRFELDATGKITLPGLGTLKQTQSREISFGLNKNLNLKGDSYGLGEVKIEQAASAFKIKKEKGAAGTSSSPKNNLSLLILVGILVVIISAIALNVFMSHRTDDTATGISHIELQQPQSKSPLTPATATEEAPVSEPVEVAPEVEPQYIVHTPKQTVKEKPAPSKSQSSASSSRCEYCVVATSLSTNEGAQHKAASYREMGYKSEVINSGNNRYRVTIGCYRSSDVAKQELRKTQKFIKDAWVLEVCK